MQIFELKDITDAVVQAFERLIPQLTTSVSSPSRESLEEMVGSGKYLPGTAG